MLKLKCSNLAFAVGIVTPRNKKFKEDLQDKPKYIKDFGYDLYGKPKHEKIYASLTQKATVL